MLGYCESTKEYRLADVERPGKLKFAHNVKFVEREMAMLNVRKESSDVAVGVPCVNTCCVEIVNVNKKGAKNHTENDSLPVEGITVVGFDSQQETV
jgi:hypothetical protein